MNYLILGAFDPELEPAKKVLSGLDNCYFAPIGIGLVEACLGTIRAITTHKDKKDLQIIFIGSAGTVKKEIELMSLVTASKCVLGSLLEMPGKMNKELSLKPLPGFREVSLWSSLGITSNEDEAKKIAAKFNADCENLELFAVASAASQFDIPVSSLNCITNYNDENAHEDWKRNYEKAAVITAKGIFSWVVSKKSFQEY